MRVVDPEDADTLLGPEEDDRQELLPELPPVLVLEVERIDVLVFLGRVLCVLDGAVGPVLEPFGVLAHVRVVGRALERDVERHVDALAGGRRDQAAEVGQGSEGGIHRLVAALLRADGPRAPGLARPRGLVVGALAMGVADGMDGRQVQDVEAHAGDLRQQTLDVLERAMFAGGAGRTREQLVPRAEPRLFGFHDHLELTRVGRRAAPIDVPAHEAAQLVWQCVDRRHASYADRLCQGGQA